MRNKLIFLLMLSSFTAFGQGLLDKSIITEGRASIFVKPEIVAFYIDLVIKDVDYEICSNEALSSISELKRHLKEAGIDESRLKTLAFAIREDKVYNRVIQKQDFIGYKAHIRLLMKLHVEEKGIDHVYEIIKDNLKAEYDLKFELSDTQIAHAKDELIRFAIQDAKNKATVIANETGAVLGDVLKVQYGDPKVISNFINPGFELLFKGEFRAELTSATSVVMETLTPQEMELKTNIVVGWMISQE